MKQLPLFKFQPRRRKADSALNEALREIDTLAQEHIENPNVQLMTEVVKFSSGEYRDLQCQPLQQLSRFFEQAVRNTGAVPYRYLDEQPKSLIEAPPGTLNPLI